MKNVLLLIHDDPGEEARLQAALDLTRALHGHLTCLDIVQVPALVGADHMMVEAEMAVLADAREREAANKHNTQAHLMLEDICWDWIDGTGDMSRLLSQEARLTAMRAGKPILAVPARAPPLRVQGPDISKSRSVITG